MSVAAREFARVALVPRPPDRAERALWSFLAASLAVHVLIALPSLLSGRETAVKPPAEISVEIVQLPPEKPTPTKAEPPPKAAEKTPEAPKPEPQKVQRAEHEKAPKPPTKQATKATAPKRAASKPVPPRSEPSKAELKPVEQARAAAKDGPPPRQVGTQARMAALLGGMDAIALPSTSPVGTDSVGYEQLVLSQVAKAKKEGRYPGVPGYATVAFMIGDEGEVTACVVARPSGDPALDAEAVAMIHRGEPYPPPPPGGRRDYVITLEFQAT